MSRRITDGVACSYQAHSPIKPVLVFVSSRRQTRLTALDLIGYAAADERPRQYVHCPEEELEQALVSIKACILPCLLLPLHDGQQDIDFLLILCYVLAYLSVVNLRTSAHED